MSDDHAPLRRLRYAREQDLAEALATEIAGDLRRAVTLRGTASLVVSGGRTPRPLLRALARQDLPWANLWVTLADERWVTPAAPDSNQRLVAETLLQGPAGAARFVPLKTPHGSPEAGQQACQQALETIPRPFDMVVLGLGEDGHTASLFPGATGLEAALDPRGRALCAAIRPPGELQPRMSLTLAALLDSRRLVLHLTGEAKHQALEHALQPGPAESMPIRAVLRACRVAIDVYWSP